MAYFDNMSRNHCNEAPLRGFLPSVHGFRLLPDAIRLGASVVDIRHVARSSIGSIALPFDWTAFAHSRRLRYCSRLSRLASDCSEYAQFAGRFSAVFSDSTEPLLAHSSNASALCFETVLDAAGVPINRRQKNRAAFMRRDR